MAVTETFVGLPEDGIGKKVDNSAVTTSQGTVLRQSAVVADAENPNARQRVTNAHIPLSGEYGAIVRKPRPSFDTGLIGLPSALAEVTPDQVMGETLVLCSMSDVEETVTIQDAVGGSYFQDYPMQPHMTQFFNLGRIQMMGIQWACSNNGGIGSVNAQLVGEL